MQQVCGEREGSSHSHTKNTIPSLLGETVCDLLVLVALNDFKSVCSSFSQNTRPSLSEVWQALYSIRGNSDFVEKQIWRKGFFPEPQKLPRRQFPIAPITASPAV